MDENNLENKGHNEIQHPEAPHKPHHHGASANSTQQIAAAILVAAVIIGGAILLKDSHKAGIAVTPPAPGAAAGTLAKVDNNDRVLGNPDAKVTVVLYEDFQCPFCGKFFKESETPIRDNYVKNGDVLMVYRDFAFLGEESFKSAEAARCAGEQGKFWEYHDYLFTHQNGENQGAFANDKLKGFAKTLGLDSASFDQCLDTEKYSQAIADSSNEGKDAGVNGTPKGFILKNGKTVDTIDGAIPFASVKQKIDAALK